MTDTTTPPAPPLHAEVAGLMLRIVVNLVKTMIPLLARHPYEAHWMEVWNYLIRCTRRFGRVLERIAAGDRFPTRKSRAGAARKEPARPRLVIPRRKDWIGQLGWQIRVFNAQIAWV
ncbi:MAG: hypothetical protein NT133_05960, partial [Alphaproteobacteria bacterium]|nr:hypothetical protein [Alphaproteobacteria bacterium]